MNRTAMTLEENYHFDVAGYLIVSGVLTAAELKACNQALDGLGPVDGALQCTEPSAAPLLALRDHPVLVHYLEQICGEGFRLDLPPRLIGLGAGEADVPLSGGSEWLDWSRSYRQHNGVRFCQGVRALWALADVNEGDGGLVVVPASHNSSVDAPQDLVNETDDMGLVVQPVLQAGDLLLCAESVIRGIHSWQGKGPQRLLECGYLSAGVRPSAESEIAGEQSTMPEWTAELTEVQRAPIGAIRRPSCTRTVRLPGSQTSPVFFILLSILALPTRRSTRRNFSTGICAATWCCEG